MQVNYELDLTMQGNIEQLSKMLQICFEYDSNFKNRDTYFSWMKVNDSSVDDLLKECEVKNTAALIQTDKVWSMIDSGKLQIHASGPYGSFNLLRDVDIFKELAKAVPEAFFEGEISGEETYAVQNMRCVLKDKLLDINTYYLSNEDEDEIKTREFLKYFQETLPYNKFVKIFKIDEDSFDSNAYDEFISNVIGLDYSDQSMEDMSFDDFVNALEDSDAETKLDEEEYKTVIEKEIQPLNIQSRDDYCWDLDVDGDEEHMVFDPVAKKYIGKETLSTTFDQKDEKEIDASGLPDGYMEALRAFIAADEYEAELADQDVLPDLPKREGRNQIKSSGGESYPRISYMAQKGDERAIRILQEFDRVNGISDE